MARQMRERLAEQGTEAVIVSSDDFYEGGSAERPQDKRLNLEKLHQAIDKLRAGEPVGPYEAAPVVLVEGLQAIDDEVVGQTPDLRAHVETDFSQRMGRRLVRDAKVGYRDVKSSLETIAKLATDNPDVFRQFEASPEVSHVDMVIENDYQEPDEPSIVVQGNQLVFSVGGQVQESRRLTPEERKAVLDLGFEEAK
jgi:uridine kinase